MSIYHDIKELHGTIDYCQWEKIIKRYKKSSVNKADNLKWTTLIHNGPVFPAPYKPLPDNIKVKYNGKPVILDKLNISNPFNLSAEEAAYLLVGLVKRFKVNTPRDMPTYAKENFMNDWRKILGSSHTIKNLDFLDISPIEEYIEEEKKRKKDKSKNEKQKEKQEKEEKKKIYGYALYDGYKAEMKSAVEPPIAFFSSSEQKLLKNDPSKCPNPLSGKLKKRIIPKDITVNGSSIPKCFYQGIPCQWGKIINEPRYEWYASWKDPVTGDNKYTVIQRAKSVLVCGRDKDKFDVARLLKKNIARIRERYMKDLTSSDNLIREKAIATYFLDTFSIRPGGNQKEDKEEGGIGLVDLKCKNVKFLPNSRINLNFIGKSGVKFEKITKIDPKIYTALREICPSKSSKNIFSIKINDLNNNYLSKMIPKLTAKSFRTWKACTVFEQELRKIPIDISQDSHIKQYGFNMANVEVGKALNHQAEVTPEQLQKLEDKRKELEQKIELARTEKQKETAQTQLDKHLKKIEERQTKIATGTSKGNYIDPRITISWAKRSETPLQHLYSKSIREKFSWAMTTLSTWNF